MTQTIVSVDLKFRRQMKGLILVHLRFKLPVVKVGCLGVKQDDPNL